MRYFSLATVIAAGALLFSGASSATVTNMSITATVPTNWQIQNLSPDAGLLIWRVPGVPCLVGGTAVLETGSGDTTATRSRLLGLIMTAKAAALPVFVYYTYDTTGSTVTGTGTYAVGSCTITSYGLDVQP